MYSISCFQFDWQHAVVVAAAKAAEVIKSIGDHQVSTSHTHQNRHILNWTSTHTHIHIQSAADYNGSNMTWRFFLSLFSRFVLSLVSLSLTQKRISSHVIYKASSYVKNLFNEYSLSMIQSKPIENESVVRDDEMKWNEMKLSWFLPLSLKWFHQHITIQKCILFCRYSFQK